MEGLWLTSLLGTFAGLREEEVLASGLSVLLLPALRLGVTAFLSDELFGLPLFTPVLLALRLGAVETFLSVLRLGAVETPLLSALRLGAVETPLLSALRLGAVETLLLVREVVDFL